MAGVAGLEPAPKVLETSMLTIDTIPLDRMQNDECKMQNPSFIIRYSSFIFFMQLVLAAAATKLTELEPVRLSLFVLCRHVIALFALSALQNNIVSSSFSHKSSVFVGQWSVVSLVFSTTDQRQLTTILIPRPRRRYRHRPCGRLRGWRSASPFPWRSGR